MTETTASVIVAVITALGSIITAIVGWLARKGVTYLDNKTKILDEASELQRKESLKARVVDTVTLAARATMQTYVDEIKARSADGKLTKDEATEAFSRTIDKTLDLLKDDGIEVGKETLSTVVEAVVGKLKLEKDLGKNSQRDEVAA